MNDAAPDDTSLLLAVRNRQEDALMTLYDRYGGAVYGLALRVTGQPASAEEVTQDVFLKVWQQPQHWDPALGRFSSWLLTTARNAAIDRLRGERRRAIVGIDERENRTPFVEPSIVDSSSWADGHEVRRLLDLLPPEQRQVLELAFYAGYTHSELAEILGLPLGTVKTRLRTALHRLREMMAQGQTQSGRAPEGAP